VLEFTAFLPDPSGGKFPNMHLKSDLLQVLPCLQQGTILVCFVCFLSLWEMQHWGWVPLLLATSMGPSELHTCYW